MKVSDVMSKHVEYVSVDANVEEIARLIFGRGINGLPVCKGKKVIGFITERDILSKFYPSMKDYIEDPFSEGDFESMEEKVPEIFSLTAEKIMSRNPTTVSADTPLLRAQSLMFVNKVGRLPVVDKNDSLIGMISKGDIFKAIVGKKIRYLESEEYHDWIAKHYDLAIGWESRLSKEIPVLTKFFKENKISNVLDIGCGTGEHAIALANNGFSVVGIENSRLMYGVAKSKWEKLPKDIQVKVKFIKGDHANTLNQVQEKFGAAIFMGNALAHMPYTYLKALKELDRILLSKNAIIIAQLINFERAINVNNRLESFNIKRSKISPEWEHAYAWFFDPPRKRGDLLTLNAFILNFNGRIWSSGGMNSVLTVPLAKDKLRKIFQRVHFSRVSFYGTRQWGSLFSKPFKKNESDWLTVVARR